MGNRTKHLAVVAAALAILAGIGSMMNAQPPGPSGPGRPGKGIRGGPGGPGAMASYSAPTLAKTEAEKKILPVLEDMNRNQRAGMMNVPEADGQLLRLLVESIGAKTVVEIGMSNGYSGLWMALGLRSTGGKLITHEIDEGRAKLARENFKRAGVEDIVTIVMGDAHEEVKKLKGPVDLCFIDADKEGYTDYLNKMLPLMRPGGLIVAHNVNPRQVDEAFVKAISTNEDLHTVFLNDRGVSISMKKR